jgi:hypothetical protein
MRQEGLHNSGRIMPAHHSTSQHSTAQHSTAQHSTAQHSTAQHSTAQHSTAQHSTAKHSTAQHSTAQHSTAQHSTAQHSTAQHSTAQHSTAQHSIAWHNTARHSTQQYDQKCVNIQRVLYVDAVTTVGASCLHRHPTAPPLHTHTFLFFNTQPSTPPPPRPPTTTARHPPDPQQQVAHAEARVPAAYLGHRCCGLTHAKQPLLHILQNSAGKRRGMWWLWGVLEVHMSSVTLRVEPTLIRSPLPPPAIPPTQCCCLTHATQTLLHILQAVRGGSRGQ